jgi:hypothetical protein
LGDRPNILITINANETVYHGVVVAVMDEFRTIEGARLGIATQRPSPQAIAPLSSTIDICIVLPTMATMILLCGSPEKAAESVVVSDRPLPGVWSESA